MQRKIPNINFRNLLSSSSGVDKLKLHSIPISKVKNVKSNVLYSIPSVAALLLVGICSLVSGESCFAADSTASLAIGQESLSTTAAQGTVAYLSSTITASSTGEMESYTLSITGPVGLEGDTTITGANNNTPANMADNTWGYAYNDSNSNENKTYKSFTGSAQTLESGTTPSGVAKNITFAAKFGENAEAGHYTGKVQVNLTTTPKAVTGAEWTLPDGTKVASGIEYMQDINTAPGGFCKNNSAIPTPASKASSVPTITLKDQRDNNSYIIGKLQDGNCWMLSNLKLTDTVIDSTNSDFTSGTITIPKSSISGFSSMSSSDGYAYKTYYYQDTDTNYYNWYTATAGAGTASVSSGSMTTSICPRNWKLPTGGTSGEYKKLGDLATNAALLNAPYNYAYTGRIVNGYYTQSSDYGLDRGFWWTSTAYSADIAYGTVAAQDILSSLIPGTYTYDSNRQYGFAIRCMARESTGSQSGTGTVD